MPSGKVGVGESGGGGSKLSAVQSAIKAAMASARIRAALFFIDLSKDDLKAVTKGAH